MKESEVVTMETKRIRMKNKIFDHGKEGVNE